MNLNELILAGVTLFVTWVLGYFSKKSKFISNNIIPLQNIAIGLIFAGVEWCITKDFKLSEYKVAATSFRYDKAITSRTNTAGM